MPDLAVRFGAEAIEDVPFGWKILVGQWLASILMLMVVRPPFVLHGSRHVSFWKCVVCAALSTFVTVTMHFQQVKPLDTFIRGGQIMYRACQ